MTSNLRSYQGKHPELADSVYVDSSAILVGDINLDHDASIWPLVAARGDVNHIRIGKRSNVQMEVFCMSPGNHHQTLMVIH